MSLTPQEKADLLHAIRRLEEWRGICPVCRREVDLRSDGRLSLHYRLGPSRTKEDRCPGGWGQPQRG